MGWIGDRIAEWRFRQSPLAQAMRAHVQRFFYSGDTLAWFSELTKERLISEYTRKSAVIFSDPDPITKARQEVVEHVLFMSPLLAVALTEDEKAEHDLYRDQPGISGALHHHIREAVDLIDELARCVFDQPNASDDEIRQFANTRSAVGLFFANGFNMVRMALGDDADRYRPLCQATMVGEEHILRQKLGLPDILNNEFDGLAYFNFYEYVLAGHADPFFAWKEDWPQLSLYGR